MSAFPVLVLMAAVTAGAPQERPPASTAAPPADVSHATPNGAPPSTDADDELPVSVDRIRRKLSEPPALKVKTEGNVFRVEVLGRKPTIEDILGPDYLKGPMPAVAGGMTHQEFLDLVTPKDVQGYAAFSNKEAAMVAATSFALKWAVLKAIQKYQDAKADRDREAARKEVQDALAELEKARIAAGLPPK
ncbi:MAG TPA: hypothetical protein VFT39_12160 [Vicinamibacterales bacterium]|nr:hypothetical protein [Vicinamibacterales bacterium]